MDLSTLVGVVAGLSLIAAAILAGGTPASFLDGPALLVVLGGTLAATLIKFSAAEVYRSLRVARNVFQEPQVSAEALIETLVRISRTVRKHSLLALERVPLQDPFLRRGIQLGLDGTDPQMVRSILENEIALMSQRHRTGQAIFYQIADSAPAFGMIGTLVGLVQMLAHLDDPTRLGPGMALALLTTLYGALVAHLIALPLAEKLKARSAEETLRSRLVLEGLGAILEGDHPLVVEERLRGFAPRDSHPRHVDEVARQTA